MDHEFSIRESLGKILRAENYEVVLAGNGLQAIEKHRAERACKRVPGCRFGSGDDELVRETLRRRSATPRACPEPKPARGSWP